MVSVTSRVSSEAESPEAASACLTSSVSPRRPSWAGATFTEMLVGCPAAAHSAACRQAFSSTQRPIGAIRPLSSARRDELLRQDDPPLGVPPAQQRLDATQASRGEVDDRLVGEEQLALLEGPAEVRLEHEPVLRAGVHAGVEELVAVLSGGLGGVQGQVRVPQQRVGAVVAADRHPDAGRHREQLAPVLQLHGLAQQLREAVGQHVERFLALAAAGQHDELVPAEAPDGVVVANRALEAFPDDLQQLVAGRVSEVVVDVLEAVDVDEQGARVGARDRAARASSCSARSSTSARFGSPVRESWRAWCESSLVFSITSTIARRRPVPSEITSSPNSTLSSIPPISSVSEWGLETMPVRAGAVRVWTVQPLCRLLVETCAPAGALPIEKATLEAPEW